MKRVFFYDAECGLCSASVRFVSRIDKTGRIDFAPLRGSLSQEWDLERYASLTGGTFIMLDESRGVVSSKSDAALDLALVLGWPWRFFRVFKWIPRTIRNAVYDWIAANRIKISAWFGAKPLNACELVDPLLLAKLRE